MPKHDEDCMRRRTAEGMLLVCTCGMADFDVEEVARWKKRMLAERAQQETSDSTEEWEWGI